MEEKLPRKTEKPWGYELLYAHTPKYVGKVIFVKKGHRLSLQYHKKKDESMYIYYHNKKDESMYIYEGKALLSIEGDDGRITSNTFVAGDCIRIPPMTRHRIEAVEDTTVLEVSTPELEDVVRVEDDYGRTE